MPPTEAPPATEPNARSATLQTTLIMAPLCLSVLLSSLDLTIVTPAVPAIVTAFHSPTGFTWLGSAYILAYTAVTPVWGAFADMWGRKPIMLICQVIFFVASLLCALAPKMDALLAGRVLQGLGASGMGQMVNTIICDSFSLRDRGLYLAITSLVWAVGSAVGPVIGGVFTTSVSWRWCFWINLPVGGVVFVVLLLFLDVPNPGTPILDGLKEIDWTGILLIIGGALMVLLALDFGNVVVPWDSPTVICLLVFGAIVIIIFALNEWKLAKNPIIPPCLFPSWSTAAAYGVFAGNAYVFIGLTYYLPLYSQSVLHANALMSGVQLLPLIVATSLSAAATAAFIQQTGKYRFVMYIAEALLTLGAGLFLDLDFDDHGIGKLVGFEIITGIGVGMNIEAPMLAAQASVTPKETAAVIGTMGFLRSIATAVSVVVGGVIFQNEMNSSQPKLVQVLGPDLARNFSGNEATANVETLATLTPIQQVSARMAYFNALRVVWIMYVSFAGFVLLLNFFVPTHHLSTEKTEAVLGVDRNKKEETANEGIYLPDRTT